MRSQGYDLPDWVEKKLYRCFIRRIGSSTFRIRNGQLTRTQNSLKSQFLMMISRISSHLSRSLPSPKNTKVSHPSLSLHAIIMS